VQRYVLDSPPELYNHGFESMESLGAVYSRISSHVFGDWNACGKVMGLASYARPEEVAAVPRFMEGALATGEFAVNWEALTALEQPNEWREADATTTGHYARLAGRVQMDLEDTALAWIQDLKACTGAENVCVCGGVAQNSVLNGRIARELGFERVFIPPYPGDEGISVGCALWGFAALGREASGQQEQEQQQQQQQRSLAHHPALRRRYAPLSPYQGRAYTDEEVQAEAVEPYGPFIAVERRPTMESVVEATVEALVQGEVVAWFQGRSECGPRALGDRSLLADPRVAAVRPFLNRVKGREAFRPFAPSVLADAAADWFEGAAGAATPAAPEGTGGRGDFAGVGRGVESPFMSLTLLVRPERRQEVPAICHVDGSARLQTVREEDNPWYHRLLQAFARRTGVPMVLNTSFNIRGEPIVETPAGAVRSFLSTHGGVGLLVLGHYLVRRRAFPGTGGGGGGLDPALCVARKADGILLEEVVRDAGNGVARSVRVALGSDDGRPLWVDLASELDLFVLSSVDGVTPLEDLVEEVVEALEEEDGASGEEGDEEPVTPEEVTASLRRLFEQQLVYFI
jgi:carbamoyltransferase